MAPTLELPSRTDSPFPSAASNAVITSGTETRIAIPNSMANWYSRKGWPWEPGLHANANKIKADAEEWMRHKTVGLLPCASLTTSGMEILHYSTTDGAWSQN